MDYSSERACKGWRQGKRKEELKVGKEGWGGNKSHEEEWKIDREH